MNGASRGNRVCFPLKPEIRSNGNLPDTKERVGTIDTESGSLDVLLELVKRQDEPGIWLFASETLAKIPEFYEELNASSIDRYVPRFMLVTRFLWFPLWQWLYILVVFPLSFVTATLLTRLITPLLLSMVLRITGIRADHHVMTLTGPLRIFILALAMWALSLLSRSILVNLFWTYAASTLAVLGTTWLTVRLIDVVVKLKHREWSATASGRVAMIQLLGKLSKAFVVIIGALFIFYIAGINITAALTGLGIGGIAIAFAAQKTLENLFGGIMIISDQPVRVGDFCKAGTYTGTVESIGLRSTYLRTPERTVVSIPNGQLAVMSLENFALRDKILFHHTVNLRAETTPAQLREVLSGITRMLSEHPQADQAATRVSLIRFADSSPVVEVFSYILETDYDTFAQIQGEILLAIMDIIEAAGTAMTAPPQVAFTPGSAKKAVGPGPEKGQTGP